MSNLIISMKTPSKDLDKSPIDLAITALAACAHTEARSGGLPGGPALDLTFLLSTKDVRPPFDGMRMGGYTRGDQTLFFEAAVPEDMSHSELAPHYVTAVLRDVIDNAAEYFRELNVDFDARRWQEVLIPLVESATGVRQRHEH
jgi:hypothetical protein